MIFFLKAPHILDNVTDDYQHSQLHTQILQVGVNSPTCFINRTYCTFVFWDLHKGLLVGTFYYYAVAAEDAGVRKILATCPKVCIPIGIKVDPHSLAGVPKIWTLTMGFFSNPEIFDHPNLVTWPDFPKSHKAKGPFFIPQNQNQTYKKTQLFKKCRRSHYLDHRLYILSQ